MHSLASLFSVQIVALIILDTTIKNAIVAHDSRPICQFADLRRLSPGACRALGLMARRGDRRKRYRSVRRHQTTLTIYKCKSIGQRERQGQAELKQSSRSTHFEPTRLKLTLWPRASARA